MSKVEQFEIERKSNRLIYLIKESNIEFYIIIPNNKQVSMVLNIMENINNDLVKNIPEFTDKVLVIPILNSNIINYLKSNVSVFEQADNYFSNLINTAYKILTHNNLIVQQLVYINNNALFSNFNNYFVNKFNGRVSLIELNLQPSSVIRQENVEVSPAMTQKQELGSELDNIYNEEIVLKDDKSKKDNVNKKEPGFVSYVLLGVIIAIVSLVFLYMLL